MSSESSREYIYAGDKWSELENEKKNLYVAIYVATPHFSGLFYEKRQKSHGIFFLKSCDLSFSPIFKMLVLKFSEKYIVLKYIYEKN